MVSNKSNNRRQKNRYYNKYVPPYSQEVLSMSVEGLGLSDLTLAVLKAGKIFTVNDIVIRRSNDMYKIQNFGKKNLFEVLDKLRALKVDFRKDEKDTQNSANFAMNKSQNKERNKESGKKQKDTKQVINKQVSNNEFGVKKADNQPFKKKHKMDNSYSSSRLFPREAFVPSPPEPIQKDAYVKMQRAGKWGFRDASGKEVIPPIYDEVFSFKEDMACVEKNGLFGYINRKNELVIPYKFECASSFSEGLACVVQNEKCGFIDMNGELVFPMEYEAATAFSEGISRAKKDGKWGLLKKDGTFSLI